MYRVGQGVPRRDAYHDQGRGYGESERRYREAHGYQHGQRGDGDQAREGQLSEHRPLEERVSGQKQRRSSEGQRDGGGRAEIVGVGDDQLVASGDRNDARDHRQVEVGVRGASYPTWVLRGGEDLTSGLRGAGEVEPPQRHAAEEGHHERRYRGHGRLDLAEGRAGYQDRLAQSDDHEQLAPLGEMPALNGPHYGGGPAETRCVETDDWPRVLHGQGERPQHVARLSLQQAADDPQHPGRQEPEKYSLEVPAQRIRPTQGLVQGDTHEHGAPHLDGHVG